MAKMKNKFTILTIDEELYNPIRVMQGDTGRYLTFQILDEGVVYSLVNRSVKASATKRDGTKVFNNLTIIDEDRGICELKLTSQILFFDGWLNVELTIYEGIDTLSIIPFTLDIIASIRDDSAIESTNEFSALTMALNKVEEWNAFFEAESGKIEAKYTVRLNELSSQMEEKSYKMRISINEFPRLAIETNDSPRIQRAFSLVAQDDKEGITVEFPCGEYEILTTCTGQNISMICDARTVFKAVGDTGYMFDIQYVGEWLPSYGGTGGYYQHKRFVFDGGTFIGNDKMSGIRSSNGHNNEFNGCLMVNCKDKGIHIANGSKYYVINCTCRGTSVNSLNNVGFYVEGSDHHFIDCVVADYSQAFYVGGNGYHRFTRCHHWITQTERLDISRMFEIRKGNNTFLDCYMDTVKVGFDIFANYNTFTNCCALNNSAYPMSGAIYYSCNIEKLDLFINGGMLFDGKGYFMKGFVDSPYIKVIGVTGNVKELFNTFVSRNPNNDIGYEQGYYNDFGVLIYAKYNYTDLRYNTINIGKQYNISCPNTRYLKVSIYDETYKFIRRFTILGTEYTFIPLDKEKYYKIGIDTIADAYLALSGLKITEQNKENKLDEDVMVQLDSYNLANSKPSYWKKTGESESVIVNGRELVNNDVKIPTTSNITLLEVGASTNYSFELTINKNLLDLSATKVLCSTCDSSLANGVALITRSTGTIELADKNTGGAITDIVSLSGITDKYIHVIGIINGTNKTIQMVVNGVVGNTKPLIGTSHSSVIVNHIHMQELYVKTIRLYNKPISTSKAIENYNFEKSHW